MVTGGTKGIDYKWYTKLIEQYGCAGHFDHIGVHSYSFKQSKGNLMNKKEKVKIDNLVELLGTYDLPADLFFTEIGWSTNPSPNGVQGKFSLQGQAKNLVDSLNYLNEIERVGAIFVFSLMETCKIDNTNHCWGLLNSDFTKKPAFDAYKELIGVKK